ncbi:hypothetical protein E2C01_081107 [Portunus trituberculatus]|uniref:Uncharacterized protein n=1 Tax=Portunus trituberculatus TaxID=210409 RepID=A0A5B7J1C8_PORTR|nr:hypothetical protein [Portunus trituberculatus]
MKTCHGTEEVNYMGRLRTVAHVNTKCLKKYI